MEYKIDLHTHSIISRDGGITATQYERALAEGMLDCIAITDHNEISFALRLQRKLGEKIIVGEEITTNDGEMIGLFLKERVAPGASAKETVQAIHKQGGLVLIPHPFETFRKGIQGQTLESLHDKIDLVETFNARARFRGKSSEAEAFVQKYSLAACSDSDAHGYYGLGSSYSLVSKMPTSKTLATLLKEGAFEKDYAPIWTYLYPAMNRLKHTFLSS